MKNKISIALSSLVLLACALFAEPAFGQATLTQTTLSAAIQTSAANSMSVTSATGFVAGASLAFIVDATGGNSEAVFVNTVSGTTIGITRGYNGAGVSNPHPKSSLVFVGPPASFYYVNPSGSAPFVNGVASCANTPVTPYINIMNGTQWLCSPVTLSWVPGWFNDVATQGMTAAVASVAGATLPSGPLFHITGTNAITAWGSSTTVFGTGAGGSTTDVVGAPFCIIPDAIFTTTATNNIALATTAVVNKQLCYVFDQTNKKYVPNY
jgi:hypothetical protein